MAGQHYAGPVLFVRGFEEGELQLAAVLVLALDAAAPGDLVTGRGGAAPETLLECAGYRVLRYRFSLPAESRAWYELAGERYEVNADCHGDLRIAYVSCNGQEHGDLERPEESRNALWYRLAGRQQDTPLNLLLQGGDQLYADELTATHPLTQDWPDDVPATVPSDRHDELHGALREAFFLRYLEQISHRGFAWLAARVPILSMWDDHDICDGWGSLPEDKLDSDVGRAIFAAAREMFLVFQFGAAPGEVPPICPDRSGRSLSWILSLPGVDLLAPDLRSERRPDRVMGPRGWHVFEEVLERAGGDRLLVLSSVPALGPRLSLVESAMRLTPWAEGYEDDLRDQWQSHAHREEWRRFLRTLVRAHEAGRTVTLLSGEIHLAARGTMATAAGPLHQLVASGISHPPPPTAYARALGLLARFGEAPLKGHPIGLRPLPGSRMLYTNQRNYLMLNRKGERWSGSWELEDTGVTAELSL